MKRAILKHRADFVAIVALAAVATACALYILNNQRVRFPLLEPKPFTLRGEFFSGQAITPGQGQTVRLAGVRLGDITDVELEDGRALVTFELDPEHEGIVRTNWRALLRPKTGLKDMFVELIPGPGRAPPAPANWVMPVANTLPDVNPDEILASLDRDTRDYLELLLAGASDGLEGRSDDLRAVFRRLGPTYRDLGRYSAAVAQRRAELRRLVTALARLNTELGRKDDELAGLVRAASRVFATYARERVNVATLVRRLPGALRQTTETLGKVERLARVLRPSADRLRPAIRAVRRANEATLPFAREIAPLLRRDIRPFVREAAPVVRGLGPAAADLVEAEPTFTRTVAALNGLFNLLAFNRGGREAPGEPGRDEGFLFYLAWLTHQSVSIFSGSDAHGSFRPLTAGGLCSAIRNTAQSAPGAEFVLGLTGALHDPRVCGATPASEGRR